jgi:hypothetical protein
MRITELVGTKEKYLNPLNNKLTQHVGARKWSFSQPDILNKFVEQLTHLGFKNLGNGAFGVVFTHPKLNYCIKIFRVDPAYKKFVTFCFNNQKDPHLPKFKGKVIKIGDDMYAVRIELLTNATQQASLFVSMVKEYNFKWGIPPMQWIKDNNYAPTPEKQSFCEANIGLFTTYDKLKSLLGKSLRFDLHEANYMMRGNIIVMTDPFVTKQNFTLGKLINMNL